MEEREWACVALGDLQRKMVEDEGNLGHFFLGKCLRCLGKCRTREKPREHNFVKCHKSKGRARGFPKVRLLPETLGEVTACVFL